MQISVTGHHVEVTDALREYIHKKMDRIVRHFDQLMDVHYVISVEKLRHKAEATLKVRGGDIHAGLHWALANREAAVDRIRRGQTFIEQRFSIESISSRWQQLFDTTQPTRSAAELVV